MYIQLYIHIYIYIYMYMYMYIQLYIHIYIYLYMYTQNYVHTCVHVFTHAHTHTLIRIYLCVCAEFVRPESSTVQNCYNAAQRLPRQNPDRSTCIEAIGRPLSGRLTRRKLDEQFFELWPSKVKHMHSLSSCRALGTYRSYKENRILALLVSDRF